MKRQKQKKHHSLRNKGKLILSILLSITTLFDFITFAINKKFWAFDMSPLVVFTKSLGIIMLVKFGVVAGCIYLLYKAEVRNIWKFMYVLMIQYLILAQLIGGISNIMIAKENPPVESAPTPQQAAKAGYSFAWLYAYYPIAFAMLAFKLWEWCYINS